MLENVESAFSILPVFDPSFYNPVQINGFSEGRLKEQKINFVHLSQDEQHISIKKSLNIQQL
jgi:hypothetical protein